MQYFQEHTVEPCPLFINENYHEEINHPWTTVVTEQHNEENIFLMGHVYDDYESDPWESQEEEPEEPEEKQKGQFISCPEPISEQPSS